MPDAIGTSLALSESTSFSEAGRQKVDFLVLPRLIALAVMMAALLLLWKATLLILEEAGHAISFAATKHPASPVLVEVVAPSSLDLPRTGRIEIRPLLKAGRDRVKTKLDLLYECAYAIETCTATEFARREVQLRPDSSLASMDLANALAELSGEASRWAGSNRGR